MELFTLTYSDYEGENSTRIFTSHEGATNAILEDLNENEQLYCMNITADGSWYRSFLQGTEPRYTIEEAYDFDYYFDFTITSTKVEGDIENFLQVLQREKIAKSLAI